MGYDPTQQVPPPGGYPPQGYPQSYPPPQGYAAPPPPYGAPPAGGAPSGALLANLGLGDRICVVAGLILLLSFAFTWFSGSVACKGSDCARLTNQNSTSTTPGQTTSDNGDRSASGFTLAFFGHTNTVNVTDLQTNQKVVESFGFVPLFLALLASLALIGLPLLVAMKKLAAQQGRLFILISAGVALLIEVIFLFSTFSAFPLTKKNVDEANAFLRLFGGGKIDATLSYATGPSFGFWLGLLATLAAGGAYLYFNYLQKPALAGAPAGVYAQPLQYPGAPPYQQPTQYPGSQPYQQPTQYPGAPPYQPPTQYPGSQPYQPPPAPGQQPGQYPPLYPGQ